MTEFEKIINSAWDKKDKIDSKSDQSIIDAIKKTIELLDRKDFENYNIIDLRIDGKIIVE